MKAVILIIFLLCFFSSLFEGKKHDFYVKNIQCRFNTTLFIKEAKCWPKSYSRTISTVNIYGVLRMPINDIMIGGETTTLLETM